MIKPKPYHKIENLWTRNPDNSKELLEGQWKLPVFEALRKVNWLWYEKVDGTNVRVAYSGDLAVHRGILGTLPAAVKFYGRNDLTNSDGSYKPPSFSGNLWKVLRDTFTVEWFETNFDLGICGRDANITLYGEGFGAGIQKGSLYGEANFCLFDIAINDVWMEQDFVDGIALSAHLQRAPLISTWPLEDAIQYARKGFHSFWGPFQAEGLVVRPPVELADRFGNRIIGKIKGRDFPNG